MKKPINNFSKVNRKRVLGISFVAIFAVIMIFPQIAIASDDPQNTNINSSDQETAGSTLELTVAGRGGVPAEAQSIPDWVKNQFDWYLKGEIDEKTLLTSMNWMFDNNIMFLSEKAATEVNELKMRVSHLENLLSTSSEQHKIDPESGTIRFGDGVHGSIPPSGEPVPYSCDGTACSCDGSACWDLKSEGKCHEDKLWCEDHEDDASYSCVCWEKTTAGKSLVDFDDIESKDTATSTGERIMQPEFGSGDSLGDEIEAKGIIVIGGGMSGATTAGGNGDIIIIGSFASQSETASEIIGDILRKGGTTLAWEDGITAFSEHGMSDSVNPELAGIVVLYNNEIDKKAQSIDAELKILEQWLDIIAEKQASTSSGDVSSRLDDGSTTESNTQYDESDLDFISRSLSSKDQQIKALDTGIMVLEQKLSSVGGDAQLVNIDLQNSLQKQQQTLQTMSNVSKMLHDTAMSIIRNMK